MSSAQEKAELLVEAFSYIDQFKASTVVIKYGGNAMTSEDLEDSVLVDIAMLHRFGVKIVLVHGGGPFVDEEMKKQNISKKTIHGLRVTDDKTLKIIEKVFATINRKLQKKLHEKGITATNATSGLIEAKTVSPELFHVGNVKNVHTHMLTSLLGKGVIPIISPLGESSGQVVNINADTVASGIASALKAEKLTILTNVRGVTIDGKFQSHLSIKDTKKYITNGEITAGMIPKVNACMDAVLGGVQKAHLINGTTSRALLLEIFTQSGIGTEIVKND